MESKRCNSSRWECQNVLGMIWVVTIFATIVFYHLWWFEGSTVVQSLCKVQDANVKETTCLCKTSNCPQDKWTCFYPIWWVKYRDHKYNGHNECIKGHQYNDIVDAKVARDIYSSGNKYPCFYEARKASNVRWQDSGSNYFYVFIILFFFSSILPCFCYMIGINYILESMLKLFGASGKKKMENGHDIVIFSPFDNDMQRAIQYQRNSRSLPRSRAASEEEYVIQEDYQPLEDEFDNNIEPVI